MRKVRAGEELVLREVFYSSIHENASREYSPAQLAAWAPREFDRQRWIEKIQQLQPFVIESGGSIIGYADLQPDGYIDHFYVAGGHARRGAGSAMMHIILEAADSAGLHSLHSDVSLTAQPFFAIWGFQMTEQRLPMLNGVIMPHARMCRKLAVPAASA